jgi:hypothetical protein
MPPPAPYAYLLVCDELPDRRDAAVGHFHARGVYPSVWKAAHGKTWGLETSMEYDPGKRLPSGHVSLNVSTWFMWQHAHLRMDGLPGSSPVLFFEDDAVLPEDFWGVYQKFVRDLNSHCEDWDIAFLGLADREPQVWTRVTERVGPPDSRLCRLNDPFGTHAYVLRKRALPVLLDKMRAAHRNLDQQLWARVLQPGHLKWCAVLPSLVTQRTCDYGSGRVEWSPSCIDAPAGPASVLELGAQYPPDPTHPGLRASPGEVPAVLGVVTPYPTDLPGRPSAATITATNRLVDPYPCMFRGEMLEDDGDDGNGRAVPLSQCARLNVPCHAKSGRVVVSPAGVRDCELCDLRKPMADVGVRPRLPLSEHFNPSMLEFGGRLILATRDSWGHSKVALWELTNSAGDWSGAWSVAPIGSFAAGHLDAPRLEDPRLFIAPDRDGVPRLCAMFNLPDGYPPKRVRVGYCRFTPGLDGIDHTEVYLSPHNNLYEKNWVPFFDPARGLNWVYATKPRHVVIGESAVWETPNPLAWTGGAVRGGAAPAFVSGGGPDGQDVYYHFFHGCLKRIQGSVYTVGCSVFEAAPPYRVLRQTPTPLLWPDEKPYDEEVVKRYVLWPGGAVRHAGHWHLALGIDDTWSRVVRLSCASVDAALSAEPGADGVVSIRDTAIARGTSARDAVIQKE